MPICFKRLHDKAFLPSRGSTCAAGLDLYTDVGLIMSPGVICKIGTGVAAELPPGSFGMIATRSSVALRGITVFTTIVDSDYRGELFVTAKNDTPNPILIERGERLAQLVVSPFVFEPPIEVMNLSSTERGTGGYGSTGR